MKKMRKMLAAVLMAVMVLSILSGCGGAGKKTETSSADSAQTEATTSAQVKEEPLKVDYLVMHSFPTLPEPDNFIHTWLLENKNIDIQFNSIVEKQTDRMNMMLASGDIPDVVNIVTDTANNEIVNKWGDAGHTIVLDEWLGKYPDFEKYGDEKYNKTIYANKKDGKMYMIPIHPAAHKELMFAAQGPFMREDWLKLIGKEAPKTTDELYEVLKAFKEQIPDVDGAKIIPATFIQYRQIFGYTWTTDWALLSQDNKDLKFYFNNPELEGYFLYMNKLYRDGLLDKEIFTQKEDQYKAKLSSGRVGFSLSLHAHMDVANTTLKASDPNKRFIPIPPIRVEGKSLPVYSSYSPTMFGALVISKKFAENTRNLERLMEFLSWNTTDEGAFILANGPEGQYFDKNSEGLFEEKPEVKDEKAKPNNKFLQRTGLTYYNLMMYPVIPKVTVDPYETETKMAQPIWKEAFSQMDLKIAMSGEGPAWQAKWGKMWEELPNWEVKCIFAKSEEECKKAYQEMQKEYEKNGGKEITDEKLKLIQEYVAKNP